MRDLLRQQESLREVIESISSELELRPLLTRIVHHACELLDADNGTIGLVDPEKDVVRTEAAYRMPENEIGAEMGLGVGLAGHVLALKQPVVLNSYGEVPLPTQTGLVQNAVIGMPILWHGVMIGFFGLGSPPPRVFTDQDVEVLALYAKHAAIAIENARLFSANQEALQEMRLLYETNRRIAVARDVREVVAAYLEQVAAGGRYTSNIALYEENARGERITVNVQGRWTPGGGASIFEEKHPYAPDSLDPILDEGKIVTISDVRTDSRVSTALRDLQIRDSRPSLAMIPLLVRGWRIGLVILSYPEPHAWRDADLWPFQATAAQLATAIDSRAQQLIAFRKGREIAVLQERHRLARDLHDSVTQILFSITLIAQTIVPSFQRDPAEGANRVDRLLDLSQAALAEMRALLEELRLDADPGPEYPLRVRAIAKVRTEGLVPALEELSGEFRQDGLHIRLTSSEYNSQPHEVEEALYGIAREALTNVMKHAGNALVEMGLTCEADFVLLSVKDNGSGFHPGAPRLNGLTDTGGGVGMGLSNMRERAGSIGGSLHIDSRPGGGTLVQARIPIQRPGDNL